MSVSVSYNFLMKGTETVDLGLDLASNPTVPHEISQDATGTLDANSSQPVTEPWSDQMVMSGGTDTIDLTALVYGNGTKVPTNMTGLKVQMMKLHCPADNVANVAIDPGATNGYDFNFGAGGLVIPPGGQAQFSWPEAQPDVSATVKTIDIVGTAADVLDILMFAG